MDLIHMHCHCKDFIMFSINHCTQILVWCDIRARVVLYERYCQVDSRSFENKKINN